MQGEPIGPKDLDVRSAVAFSVAAHEQIVAVIGFFSEQEMTPDDRVANAMKNGGIQLGHLIERWGLEWEIAEATAREQRRIGQELHDNLGQSMTGLGMIASALAENLKKAQALETPSALKLFGAIENAWSQIRAVMKGVMPIEGEGLMAALEELTASAQEMHKSECRFQCPDPVLVKDAFTATNLYLIAHDAVHNALKYLQGDTVAVRLTADDSRQWRGALRNKSAAPGPRYPYHALPRSLNGRCIIVHLASSWALSTIAPFLRTTKMGRFACRRGARPL